MLKDFTFNFKPKRFNSYKGTIVIVVLYLTNLHPSGFNSYKGTIVIM